MAVNYDCYRIFYEVVDSGSISAAAGKLFLSQSTVSRIIQNLERSLGCTLLSRSKQGVTLTENGKILHNHLKIALEHIIAAEERLDNIRRLDEGLLRIGASELTLEFYLLPYLDRLKREHRNIQIRLSYSNPQQAVADLNSGLLDIAVLASPLFPNEAIDAKPVREIRLGLIAGPGFPELRMRPVDFRDLADYPFICMEKGMAARLYADQMAEKAGFVLHPECEVGSMPLLISMVQINLGLAFCPALHSQKSVDDGSVFSIHLTQRLPKEHICLLTSRRIPQSNVTKYFMDMLFEQ